MHGPLVRRLYLVAIALLLFGAACTDDGEQAAGGGGQAAARSTLQSVKDRGTLVCGVNNTVPGFGIVDEQGNFSGFDIEFCRVVAAAVLGDAQKVQFRPIASEQRFTALQAREIDVLIRNTTWTAKRDGAEAAAFVTTTFYDGQGMMVRTDSRFRRLEDLDGATICVLSGTTTELNLASVFRSRRIDFTPLSFPNTDEIQQAFLRGRCQGWTSDKSQLAGHRSSWPRNQGGPEALRILDETMSKEPLGPLVRDGDSDWFDAVNWAVIATIQAEEFDVSSRNVDQIRRTTTNPEIRRFLGAEEAPAAGPTPGATPGTAAFDPGLGLPADFAYQIVKQVGNYEEIYERTVGRNGLGLERRQNALWTEDGLMYAPPYR